MQRPFTGVRSLGLDLAVVLDRCRAYEPLLRPNEAFSHGTAALLYGLPMPADANHGVDGAAAIEVTAAPGYTRARSAGVRGHVSATPFPIAFHLGLPVIRPEVVWCQLAARLRRADLIAVGDAIVTGVRRGVVRSSALATPEELVDSVRRWGRRRGARALAEALALVRVGAESRPETHLRVLLTDFGLPEPVPNDPTQVAGETLHPDLKYSQARLVLEYQGDHHRTDRTRWQADVRRKRAFELAGWRVVEVTANDLYADPTGLIARVRSLLAE